MKKFKTMQIVVRTKSGKEIYGDVNTMEEALKNARVSHPSVTEEDIVEVLDDTVKTFRNMKNLEHFYITVDGDEVYFNPDAIESITVRIDKI